MDIIKLKITEIKPYDKNPRKNDGAVDAVAESIKQCGYCAPIVIDEDNVILAGHTRLKALKKLKYKECECVRKVGMTEEQKRKYRLLDNKTNEFADWDIDLLNGELEGLDFLGFDFGFDITDLSEPKEVVEDVAPEVDEESEPITQFGDIWQLGEHRLCCGDSTDKATVERLMNGKKADMVFTDPPYNVDYSNADRPKPSSHDLGKIKNDAMNENEFYNFLVEIYKRLDENTNENSSFYIWYASINSIPFLQALEETNIKSNQQIIWKKPMLLGRGKYQWAHEPCIFGIKGSPYFTEDRTKTTVWDFGGYDKSKNVHPTQKPLFLPSEAINNSSKKGQTVLDVFGGSGSTLIACEQLNRRCYMMELDPKYCDVIVKRWENLTGKKAKKINGE